MKINKIYLEKSLKGNSWAAGIIRRAGGAEVCVFDDLRALKNSSGGCGFLKKDVLIVARQKGKFLINCPCSKNQVSCGYYIIDWGLGCPYRCRYCYLNYYQNVGGMLVYANLDDCFGELDRELGQVEKPIRVGTGEFMDSLALEKIMPAASRFVEYFAGRKNAILELKTKSINIGNLAGLKHNGRTVVGWSVNPQKVIEEYEPGAPALSSRLRAMVKTASYGYPVALHFDPVIYGADYERDYADTLRLIFSRVDAGSVAWISLGTLRFDPGLKRISVMFYGRPIGSCGEMCAGSDGKIRYFRFLRREIYKTMIDLLAERVPLEKVYLCMESPEMWKDLREYSTTIHKVV